MPTAENLVSVMPKLNDYAAVYSSKYNGCYRAKVIGPNDDGTANFKCSLIDFGYIDNIPSKYIFALPNDYAKSKVRRQSLKKITMCGIMIKKTIQYFI